MILYALLRESSGPQERKKGLARQWRQINRFAETWPGGPHAIYQLHAQVIESASQRGRLAWQAAINQGVELYRRGAFDGVLFPEVDRETRNPLISVPILRFVLDAGIPVFFAEPGLRLDPNDPSSVSRYTEEVAKSCTYIDTMVRKTRAGRFDRANSDGKLPTNAKMFGFDIVDGRKVVNEAQAAALRQAGEIILREGRPGPAAKWLNAQGWQTTYDKRFTRTTLAGEGGIFRNRALIGETVIDFREKQVIVRHDPILDVATFEAINAVLDGRRLREPRSKAFYALSGLGVCGCGANFEQTKSGKYRYYRCRAKCGEKAWRKESFERAVWDSFGDYLKDRQRRMDYLDLARQCEAKLQGELDRVQRDLEANSAEWRALLNKDLGGYPAEIVEAEKRELSAARESLLWEKARIEGQLLLLPQVDPTEVEKELAALGEPWLLCDWSLRGEGIDEGLPREQAEALKQTLLRLGATVEVRRREIRILGRLPLKVGAKKSASGTVFSFPPARPVLYLWGHPPTPSKGALPLCNPRL